MRHRVDDPTGWRAGGIIAAAVVAIVVLLLLSQVLWTPLAIVLGILILLVPWIARRVGRGRRG